MPQYTKEELLFLKKEYSNPNITVREIAEKLNRRLPLVRMKAKKMGFKKAMKHHSTNGWKCSSCGIKLIENVNWAPSYYRRKRYKCAKCVREKWTHRKYKLRQEIINLFGGICKKCGYSNPHALQIDHIYGGGRKDITKFKGADKYYKHLLSLSKEEREKKYQLLCANCNKIKQYERGEFVTPRYGI